MKAKGNLWAQGQWLEHRYQIELNCSLGQFKSAKLEDKEYTINATKFFCNIAKKERD